MNIFDINKRLERKPKMNIYLLLLLLFLAERMFEITLKIRSGELDWNCKNIL